ncbi:unnamed protein product [Lepidochelys olivacea]
MPACLQHDEVGAPLVDSLGYIVDSRWKWNRPFTWVAGAQSPVTAQYGENVILNCTFPFISGVKFQRLIVTWKKERDNGPGLLVHKYYWGMDQLYKQDKDYKGRTRLFPERFPEGNASLQLHSVRMQDEGSYCCYVNSELNSTSRTMPLSVIREIQVEETISAQQGEDVIMNCSFGPVSNLQLLNITWKKGSDLLVHSYFSQLDQLETQDEAYRGRTQLYPERFHEGNASLRLKNVRLEDKGFYTCHVKPELGRFSMRMRVTVEKAPENAHSSWLWLLLLCVTIPPLIYIILKSRYPSLLQSLKNLQPFRPWETQKSGVCTTAPHPPDDCLQRPARNENPRPQSHGIIQSRSEAGDHERGTLNPREEDCLLEPKERLLCPDGDSTNLSQDGGEELGAASGTGDLSDSVSGSHESLPSTGLNIALLGETGCGKSSFINAIRGLQDEDDNAARTGVIETTKKRKSYQHPKHPNVTIWDMPGIILGKFSLDRDIELSKSDVFLIFSSDNFTTLHANLAQEIQRMGKKVYFVRSKVDVDLYNNRRKRNFSESRILEQIKNTCIECLEREGLHTPRLFLLSHNEYDQHDFHCLAEELGCA